MLVTTASIMTEYKVHPYPPPATYSAMAQDGIHACRGVLVSVALGLALNVCRPLVRCGLQKVWREEIGN